MPFINDGIPAWLGPARAGPEPPRCLSLLQQTPDDLSLGRQLSGRRRSDIGGRRRCDIAWADLHRLPCKTDDAAIAVVDRRGRPIAAGSVNRLGVTWVHHIAGRPGGNDGAGNNRAADDAGGNARPPRLSIPIPGLASRRRRRSQSRPTSLRSSQPQLTWRASSASVSPPGVGGFLADSA